MMCVRRLTAGLAMAVALGTQTVCAAEAVHQFKMATAYAGGPVMAAGSEAFAEKVNKMSDGRIKVQVFPGGALGNPLKVPETVKHGVADMGHTWIGYDWGKDPTTVLFGGFAGSPDSEAMLHWLYNGGGAEMQRTFREQEFGVISFPLFIRTPEVFLHSRKPVHKLEDLKGLKIRTAGAWLGMLEELGASPVTVSSGDVYPMLARGAIDATEWGVAWENIDAGLHRIAKYVVVPGVHQPTAPYELVINKQAWSELSNQDKWVIEEAAKLTTMESWLRVGVEDAKALETFKNEGNEIIELSKDVQIKARKIASQWAEEKAQNNDWFQRVWKDQRHFMKLWKQGEKLRNVVDLDDSLN